MPRSLVQGPESRLSRPQGRRRAEPLIALMNVVFLLLIFLLVAGTVARPLPGDFTLVEAEGLEATAPPDAAVILADGTMLLAGSLTTPVDYAAEHLATRPGDALRIVPDRDLPAERLVEIVSLLRAAGAPEVRIVTERALR
jgi:biopolymer transport protein ExbD